MASPRKAHCTIFVTLKVAKKGPNYNGLYTATNSTRWYDITPCVLAGLRFMQVPNKTLVQCLASPSSAPWRQTLNLGYLGLAWPNMAKTNDGHNQKIWKLACQNLQLTRVQLLVHRIAKTQFWQKLKKCAAQRWPPDLTNRTGKGLLDWYNSANENQKNGTT